MILIKINKTEELRYLDIELLTHKSVKSEKSLNFEENCEIKLIFLFKKTQSKAQTWKSEQKL